MQTRLFFQKNPFRLLLGGLLALLSLSAQGQLTQLQKLTPQAGERQANSLFGTSVAVDGNVMMVGAYREPGGGAAYVYEKSGGTWNQTARLTASDRAADDQFGYSVSVSGSTIVVGAYSEDEDASGSNTVSTAGSAYVFEKSGGTWSQTQKITASDRAVTARFGYSVSVSGSTLVVGAYGKDEFAGSAYVFEKSGATWSQTQKLTASDRTGFDVFGTSVSVSGSTIVVGAYQEDEDASGNNPLSNAGSAYIFEKSGATWSQTQKLTASDRANNDYFGISVSVSGSTLVVGAYAEDEDASGNNMLNSAGSAYVFEKSGGTWSQTQKLTAADRATFDSFGYSVSASGSIIVVGAYLEDQDASGNNTVDGAGSAYVFEKSGATWSQTQKLTASDRAALDQFGNSVSVSGSTIVVGAYEEDEDASGNNPLSNAGSAYVFGPSCPVSSIAYVNAAVGSTGNGSGWGTAFKTLQEALTATTTCPGITQIWVAKGTYYPDEGGSFADNDRNASFTMRKGVAIYGGFAGTEAADYDLSQRNFVTNETILSGDIDHATDPDVVTGGGSTLSITGNGGNAYHVIYNNTNGLRDDARLDGFTVTGGNANGSDLTAKIGGGMYGSMVSPTVTNCVFTGNTAAVSGGGMYHAGFYDRNSNETPSGVVYMKVTNCTFSTNKATNGGGLYMYVCFNMTLDNVVFSKNAATGSNGIGGGLFLSDSFRPTLSNVVFSENTAERWGGAISSFGTSAYIANGTFSNNSVAGTATADAGGISFSNDIAASRLYLLNCVFWNNRIGTNAIKSLGLDVNRIYAVNSDFQDLSSLTALNKTNCIEQDPQFVDANDPDGPDNQWRTADDGLSVKATSPVVNSGASSTQTTAGTLNAPSTDIVGNPRPSLNTAVDMGAYEFINRCPTYASNRAYVNGAAAVGTNDGTTWATGFLTLQAALNAASTCGVTEIWVAKGTYYPDEGGSFADNDRNAAFSMKNGVALYGGFAGNEAANYDLSLRNFSTNPTILSGDIDGSGTLANNSYHVISNNNLNNTAVLDGFVITGGNADGSASNSFGGAMYNLGSSPRLTNCTFQANSASFVGGAILNNGTMNSTSSPVLTNCSFQGNSAGTYAGAMFNDAASSGTSSPVLTNCSFQGNSAGTSGGVMYNNGGNGTSNPVLTNCVLFGNGGSTTFYNANATVTATYSLFDDTVTGYNPSGTGNLTTTTSPFVSTTSTELIACALAIDAGDPATTSATVGTADLAGQPRIVRERIDMGAYEFQGTPGFSVSITPGGPTSFCAGGSVTLSAGTYSSYVWKNGDTQVSTEATYSATTSGSYTVTVTDGSCTATSSPVVVTVTTPMFTQQPSVPANLVVCANASVLISFNVNCPGSGPFTAQLSNPGGTFTSGTQNLGPVSPGVANTVTIPGLTPTSSANYRIRIVSNQPGFHSDSTGIFRINALAFSSTPTVSLTAVCAGASFKVSFTVGGNCPFLPGNAFSAELSDGSGSFASPVVLGSVNPGINTLTVPQSIPTGSGYRVRIRATAPALLSAQSAAFTVNQPSFASTPTVSLDNKCAGESVRLSFSVGCAFFSGNTFTAQLSNSAGSFASPVNVGTVSAGALNNVVIPSGTPAGTGYKIRIVSSNPALTSAVSGNFKVKACGSNREIAPEETGLRVVISPNPSPEGRLRITVTGAEGQVLKVALFNGLGQPVREQTIDRASEEETLTWDISRQPQGLYLLRVNTGKESKTVKVLH